MQNRITVRNYGNGSCLCVKRAAFTVGSTRLDVEDMINIRRPWRSSRILMISDTNAYYSEVPLGPYRHRLLCYTYCPDVLNLREHSVYRNALVLGCGGGAVPEWFLEEYPEASADVVDYSSEIIAVCKKYFLRRWKNSGRLRFCCMDAQNYQPPEYRYQFIFCDLFDGENLVPFVYSGSFAAKLRSMLSDEGILIINCGWDSHISELLGVYEAAFEYVGIVNRDPWQSLIIVAGAESINSDSSEESSYHASRGSRASHRDSVLCLKSPDRFS